MVSKAREDFPEPERPVITTSLSRGISTSMFLRLCSRAPLTMMRSIAAHTRGLHAPWGLPLYQTDLCLGILWGRAFRGNRQVHAEGRSPSLLGLHLDAAAVRPHDPVADGEPEPHPLALGLGREEGVEDLLF